MRQRVLPIWLACVLTAPVLAHVTLTAPRGGATLDAGETVAVEWVVAIPHETENWDLYYSVTGADGPWIPIVEDLPPGDTGIHSVHDYAWTVPDITSDAVHVLVVQDNVAQDYFDLNDTAIRAQGTAGAEVVDGPDVAGPGVQPTGSAMCGALGSTGLSGLMIGLLELRLSRRRPRGRRAARPAAAPPRP